MEKPIVLLGSGGHASTLIEILKMNGREIMGVSTYDKIESWCNVPVIGTDEDVLNISPYEIKLVNAIGSVAHPKLRGKVHDIFERKGYGFGSVIHPTAIISPTAKLAPDIQVMAGAIIQTGTTIGSNVLINTKASVDHDCKIGNNVHIAPGVTISGGVTVGDSVHIGAGATVIQGITIGSDSVIAAGAVVVSDVNRNDVVMGVPAKSKKGEQLNGRLGES